MRKNVETQLKLGEKDISKIQIDLKSRDEIPKLLRGLQYIYQEKELREAVFKILSQLTPKKISRGKGRKGMDYWKILVLGTLRLICNWDYDKLKDIADNHISVRQMLTLSPILDQNYKFALQTLKDNISLFTPDILDQINYEVVKQGQKLFKYDSNGGFLASCDSFVVETNVHYPTDINLLFDATRKVIELISDFSKKLGFSDWRQSKHNVKKIKILYRKIQKLKRSNSKNPAKKEQRDNLIKEAYKEYLEAAAFFLEKAERTIKKMKKLNIASDPSFSNIVKYITHGWRQISQTERRVIQGEKIPHGEKVFSVFEEHTEWISKGKAGVPQELGLKVCIIKDQNNFILNYKIMRNQTDAEIAVPIIQETRKLFKKLAGCSFDKGFYTPANREKLSKILKLLVLPKKGSSLKKKTRLRTQMNLGNLRINIQPLNQRLTL